MTSSDEAEARGLAERALQNSIRINGIEARELFAKLSRAIFLRVEAMIQEHICVLEGNASDPMPVRLLDAIAKAIGPAAFDYSDEAVAKQAYDGAPTRTAYERLPGIISAMVERGAKLREVRPANGVDGSVHGIIDVLDPEDGHSHLYVPLSKYTDAMRAANQEQMRLKVRIVAVVREARDIATERINTAKVNTENLLDNLANQESTL